MLRNQERENETYQQYNLSKSFLPMAKANSFEKGRRRFGTLLSNATNELKQHDEILSEKVANKLMVQDASALMNEWIQETVDFQVAKSVSAKLEEEEQLNREAESKESEAVALRVAVEERRRVLKEAKDRKDIEENDRSFVRGLLQKEKAAEVEFKALCAKDENVAQYVNSCLQDELFAEQLVLQDERMEMERKAKLREMEEADAKFAREQQELLSKEEDCKYSALLDQDAKLAARKHIEEIDELADTYAEREQRDYVTAHAMQVKAQREAHRYRKFMAYSVKRDEEFSRRLQNGESEEDIKLSLNGIEHIASLWENAEPEVEDVADGICITLLLPFLKDIRVRACNQNTIEIYACRLPFKDKNGVRVDKFNTPRNSKYNSDFVIDGAGVQISNTLMSYEYRSDVGLLHVYIDSLSLEDEEEEGNESSSPKKALKRGVVETLKNSFQRLFSSGSARK